MLSSVAGTLTVAPAPLTVAANPDGKTYDGLAYAGGNGITASGFVNGETAAVLSGTPTYAGTAQGAVDAETYAITTGGLTAANYALTYAPGALAIAPAPLTATANSDVKTYDGLAYSGAHGVSFAGFVNGETAAVLGGSPTYGGTAQGAVGAGSYTLTVGGLNSTNYALTYGPGTLTVAPAPLTVTVDGVAKSYDGMPMAGPPGSRSRGSWPARRLARVPQPPLAFNPRVVGSGRCDRRAVLALRPRRCWARAGDVLRTIAASPAQGDLDIMKSRLRSDGSAGIAQDEAVRDREGQRLVDAPRDPLRCPLVPVVCISS